jgi:hypothetical protein
VENSAEIRVDDSKGWGRPSDRSVTCWAFNGVSRKTTQEILQRTKTRYLFNAYVRARFGVSMVRIM